jgi:hypothetical protein
MVKSSSQGRPAYYPWSNWLNRKKKLTIREDQYHASQKSMCVMIRTQARLHGVKVGVLPKKDGSIVIVPKSSIENAVK